LLPSAPFNWLDLHRHAQINVDPLILVGVPAGKRHGRCRAVFFDAKFKILVVGGGRGRVPAGHEMLQFLDHHFTHLTRPLLFWKSAEWCRPVSTRPASVNASRSLRSGNLAKVRRGLRPPKNDTAATPDGLPPRPPQGVWPAGETMLRSRRNRPETEICSNGIGQTTGCDHVGNHHQLILPPVLQGRAVRHSKAATYLGVIAATRSVDPLQVEYDCEQAGSPSPCKRQSLPRITSGTGFRSENAPGHAWPFALDPDAETSHH
jgi:hypothetical protein